MFQDAEYYDNYQLPTEHHHPLKFFYTLLTIQDKIDHRFHKYQIYPNHSLQPPQLFGQCDRECLLIEDYKAGLQKRDLLIYLEFVLIVQDYRREEWNFF